MALLERVTEGGDYGDVSLMGTDPNDDIGLQIEIPEGETAKFGTVELTNVFVGLVHVSGNLEIDELHIYEFGGDGVNLRTGNVHIKRLIVHDNTPTRPYNEYHQDGLQAYAVDEGGYRPDPNGVIENVVIEYVDIRMVGETCQGIACTEACQYVNWQIGTEHLHIEVDYYYSMIFISLQNSVIGCEGAELNKPIRIQNVKHSAHETQNVYLVGIEPGIHAFDESIVASGAVQHANTLEELESALENDDNLYADEQSVASLPDDEFDVLLFEEQAHIALNS